MADLKQLDLLLKEQDGMLQTAQAIKLGISKPVFYNYVEEKGLKQAAHGLYVSEDTWVDGMYLLHLRCKQAVFSHEAALFFHDLTDREPSPYSITVKRGSLSSLSKILEESKDLDLGKGFPFGPV